VSAETPAQARFWRRWRSHDPHTAETFTAGRYTCPACGKQGRFQVTYDDCKVRLFCWGECTGPQIRDRLGLKPSDLWDHGAGAAGRLSGTYDYADEDGAPRLRVFRYAEPPDVRYEVWRVDAWMPERPDRRGSWPLYRAAEVVAAVEAGERVYVVDDEADADALAAAGVVATCAHLPRGQLWNVRHVEYLRGGYVTVVARRGEAGAKHARALARELAAAARDVALVEGAVNRRGAGATEHLREGYALDEFEPLTLLDEQAAAVAAVDIAEGAAILADVERFLRRFVVFTTRAQAVAVTLWVAHTWAFEAAETTLYLHVTSAEKQSGKTRLCDVLVLLCRGALKAADSTASALFRSIGVPPPTLLFDEVQLLFARTAGDDAKRLQAVLNAGYEEGGCVRLVEGEGAARAPVEYSAYCPKVLAGTGELPDMLADRSIPVRLQRKKKGEDAERFRRRLVRPAAAELRARVAGWAAAALPALTGATPEPPDALTDRQQDGWEALLAIADAAAGR